MAGKRLILPAIYAVPDGFCDTLRHIGAEERIIHVHIEVKRKRGVFRHNIKFVVRTGFEPASTLCSPITPPDYVI